MISFKIIPLAHSKAIPTITLIISFLPPLYAHSSAPHAAIITHATISKIKENTRIAVTISLLNPCISLGKAVVGPVTVVLLSVDAF
ncbi:MAG: hypothetical protein GXP45_07125 [bacterium]|nr:hypothetical protein [bacterium]